MNLTTNSVYIDVNSGDKLALFEDSFVVVLSAEGESHDRVEFSSSQPKEWLSDEERYKPIDLSPIQEERVSNLIMIAYNSFIRGVGIVI